MTVGSGAIPPRTSFRRRSCCICLQVSSEGEIAQFDQRWPIDSTERLAFAVLLFTGHRVADAATMAQSIGKAARPERCVTHGLRKAAARRLAEAGCCFHEIMAMTGHRTLAEVERYTKAAEQKSLARAAIDQPLNRRRKTRTPKPR